MTGIAVIGSGISGLGAAHSLTSLGHPVTLFEAGSHFGGHANTVDVALEGVTHGVDTGFLVFNERTYPELIKLFGELGVACAPSEMSFSVQASRSGRRPLEWSGTSLNGLLAQRRNVLSPRFWAMVKDLLQFNALATRLAQASAPPETDQLHQTIGEFLDHHAFGSGFREDYFLPMIACIWSCPTEQMLQFPVATLIRFCHNHGLLQISNRPQWFTVRGGSREYVKKIVQKLPDTRLNTPVLSVVRQTSGVIVNTAQRSETFDGVIFACHPSQTLNILGPQASVAERKLLGAIRYQPNQAVLHTDTTMLPTRRAAWAAWNYERSANVQKDGQESGHNHVCLHYLINLLQPLPWQQEVLVSLNPVRRIDERKIIQRIAYDHPVFDAAASQAQKKIKQLQGQQRSAFCGAWCGYGFHEDGLKSGLAAAKSLVNALTLVHSEAEMARQAA